jgi:hypothetical protein
VPTKIITITVSASSLADRVLDLLQRRYPGPAKRATTGCVAWLLEAPLPQWPRVATCLAWLRRRCLIDGGPSDVSEPSGFDVIAWNAVASLASRELDRGRVEWSATIEVRP